MKSIWQQLKKPIFSLAPMEDVTDTVFRQILLHTGRPDIFFTEFTNVDGMFSEGEFEVAKRLKFEKIEKPIIAQLWGLNPENFYKAAKKISKMGFDGIDLNMGCPQKNVTQRGACSALINNHSLAKEIILATKEGAGILPVSVKTRLGVKEQQIEEWFGFLLGMPLEVITIHGRTVKEMSKVPSHWDAIGKVVEMRNARKDKILRQAQDSGQNKNPNIIFPLVFGNGDVVSLQEAQEKVKTYGLDGIMIGRGIFHNIWLFNEKINPASQTIQGRLELLKKHVQLFEKKWDKKKNFSILKKYFKIYLSNFEGASQLRTILIGARDYSDLYSLIDEYANPGTISQYAPTI